MPAPIEKSSTKRATTGGSFIPLPQPVIMKQTKNNVPYNNIPGGTAPLKVVKKAAPKRAAPKKVVQKRKPSRGGWTMNTNTRSL
jgi:hypothetical protein